MWGQRTADLWAALRVPALVVPVDGGESDWTTAKRAGADAAVAAMRAAGVPCRVQLVQRRPRHPRPAPGRARGGAAGGRSRRALLRGGAGVSAAALPRILTIMGSGETTPTMARVHRAVLDRLGERPVPAVLLDTPYGFQENADDISDRALDYFRDSVGTSVHGRLVPVGRRRRAGPRDGPGPNPRGAPGLRRAGQPHLRAAAVGRHGDPAAAGREARAGRRRDDGQRRGPDARPLHDPRLRDLQGGRGAALAPGWTC